MRLNWIFLNWELVSCTQSSVISGTSRGLNFGVMQGLRLGSVSQKLLVSPAARVPGTVVHMLLLLFGATFLRWRWRYSLFSFLTIFFCMSVCKLSSRWQTSSRCLPLRNSEMICKLDVIFGWEVLPADRHALYVGNWLWVFHVNTGQLKICGDMVSK